MASNAWQALLAADFTKSELMNGLILRTVYVLGAAEDVTTIDLQTSLAVISNGDVFWYDPTDSSTAHDGTTVLVDLNGRRYKIVDQLRSPRSVLDRLATPPGSPSVGDAYLVTAGATGDWSGQDDDVAIYAAAGWTFVAPVVGMPVYVEDETAFYHYDAGGSWSAGLGSLSLAADAVTPIEDQFWGLVSVEDTLNTPPGSPTDGLAWLVGTSPTGDFVGHNDKIAYRRSSAWTFLSPYEGARIWDKDADQYLTYKSSAWTADPSFSAVEVAVLELSAGAPHTTVELLDLGDFIAVEIVATGLQFSTGSETLAVETSADNGSSWDSTGFSITVDNLSPSSPGGSFKVYADGLNRSDTETFLSQATATSVNWRDALEINNALRISVSGGSIVDGNVLIKKTRG